MNNTTNAWFFLGAAIIGAVSAASVFLIEQYRQDKRKHTLTKDLARLDGQLSTLREELETLRALQKEKNEKSSRSNRRKQKSVSSAASTVTDDYRSAIEYDSSDLEFYDLTSEESETENDKSNKSNMKLDKLQTPLLAATTVTDYKSFIDAIGHTEFHDLNEEIVDDEYLKIALTEIDGKLNEELDPNAEEALDKLTELSRQYPNNSELLWRTAKAHKILATRTSDNEMKKEHIMKGVELCEKAVQLKPRMAIFHKWLAILVGMRSDLLPVKERILNGYEFKKHCDTAVELSPDDPLLHHMLGRFAYELAQLSWLERTIAQKLFAEVPKLSHEDALKHFMEAERLSEKDWKENKLYIAKCSLAIGRQESAVEWLNKAELSNSIEEEKVHEEVKKLLEKYS